MKLNKIALILTLILVLFIGVTNAQTVFIGKPQHGDVATAADSTSFRNYHYFPIPEGLKTDEIQLNVSAYSSDGAAHLVIRSWYAFYLGGPKKHTAGSGGYVRSPDSTTLASDHSIEAYTGYRITGSAKDTTENGAGGTKLQPNAIVIMVGGYTANRADTEYWIQLSAEEL